MARLYDISSKASIVVGRDYSCDLVIMNKHVSRRHIIITTVVKDLVAKVEILGKNGAYINKLNIDLGNKVYICTTDIITVGQICILWLGKYLCVEIMESDAYSNEISNNYSTCLEVLNLSSLVNKSMAKKDIYVPIIRKNNRYDTTTIEIENPPARKQPERISIALAAGPAFTMAIPIVLGSGRMISVFTSIVAAFWAIANVVMRKRKLKNEERRRRNGYASYINERSLYIRERFNQVVNALNNEFPPIEQYFKDGPNSELIWNRTSESEYYHKYRIGIGQEPFPISINTPKSHFEQINDSLKELPNKIQSQYEVMSNVPVVIDMQDVKAIGLASDDYEQLTGVLSALLLQITVNNTPDDICITKYIDNGELNDKLSWLEYLPHYARSVGYEKDKRCIFITDVNSLDIYDQSIDSDMVYVCLVDRVAKMPAYVDFAIECSQVGVIHDNRHSDIANTANNIRLDEIGKVFSEQYARSLARIWNGLCDTNYALPDIVSFGSSFGDDVTNASVRYKWENNDAMHSLAFPIGIAEGGKIVVLDIHERGYGPHGIISGTTGSGKSELLTTVILSAACSYSPEVLGFFLIDYKGGGMSNQFSNLPHLLGSISNLSIEESRRAMLSLRSENIRRQRIFSENNVNNICDYIALYKSGLVNEPLPHVLIIVDEFAELKKEQPDFMQELISVAAVGRSLGMHLILATQKPAGIIDDKIRSNSRFRICLRVEDKTDSIDMLHKPDAASINNCGRAYLQVGNDEVYTLFQSAYAAGNINKCEKIISIFGEDGDELYSAKEETVTNTTWHDYCIKLINNLDKELNMVHPKQLWLPQLPVEMLYRIKESKKGKLTIGVVDDPEYQRYMEYSIDISEISNICIIGPLNSGKSNLLQIFAYEIINNFECKKSNIYIIDYSSQKLENIANSPLCGGYITQEHKKRIPMLIMFIGRKLEDRRRKIEPIDLLLVFMINNFGEVIKDCNEQCLDILHNILKYGKAFGIVTIITSIGGLSCDIPFRFLQQIDNKIVLGRIDSYQAASYLGCISKNIPNTSDLPGRGLVLIDDRPLVIQCFLNTESNYSMLQVDGVRTQYYPYVPEHLNIEEFLARVCSEKKDILINGPPNTRSVYIDSIPIGYEEETGRLYEVNLTKTPLILIGGKGGEQNAIDILCIVAARFGINIIYAINAIGLISIIEEIEIDTHKSNQSIIIIKNLNSILNEFYSNPILKSKEALLVKYFDNNATNKQITIVGVVTGDLRRQFSDEKAITTMLCKPYTIYFGGQLDDQRMFDFSYLPYTKQSIKKRNGQATVLKYSRKMFYGDVIIPGICENDD